jgi:hypothetical protein
MGHALNSRFLHCARYRFAPVGMTRMELSKNPLEETFPEDAELF